MYTYFSVHSLLNWRFSVSTFLFFNLDSDMVPLTTTHHSGGSDAGGRAAVFIFIFFHVQEEELGAASLYFSSSFV